MDIGAHRTPVRGTLPPSSSRPAVIAGYGIAAAAAYVVLVAGVVVGLLPLPALLPLLALPLALQGSRGLEPYYDSPYGLMAIMGVNIKLHLMIGLALLAAYAVVHIAGAVAPGVRLSLG